LEQAESAEFAGCEALRAEQSANDIRSIVAERKALGNNNILSHEVKRHRVNKSIFGQSTLL